MTGQVDGNVRWEERDGRIAYFCAHCQHLLAEGEDYFPRLAYYEGPSSLAGPQVASNSQHYVDDNVLFGQYCCPHCFTAYQTQVVPERDRGYRLAQREVAP